MRKIGTKLVVGSKLPGLGGRVGAKKGGGGGDSRDKRGGGVQGR